MKALLKRWWDGRYVPPQNDPGSLLWVMQGHYQKHWSSKAAHVVADFWQRNWQWCFSAVFAVTGLVIAALKL